MKRAGQIALMPFPHTNLANKIMDRHSLAFRIEPEGRGI